MAKALITGFLALEDDGTNTNTFGLKTTVGSTSKVQIQGSNLSAGMPVNVDNNHGIKWSGTLEYVNSVYICTLTCTSNQRTGLGDTENVTVTVGSGESQSDPTPEEVDVGLPGT